MGQTKKRQYDRYTLDFKLQSVKLANNPNVRATDIAHSLGIHVVMLYRWQMEHRNGELRANKHMKSPKPSPKPSPSAERFEQHLRLKQQMILLLLIKKSRRLNVHSLIEQRSWIC